MAQWTRRAVVTAMAAAALAGCSSGDSSHESSPTSPTTHPSPPTTSAATVAPSTHSSSTTTISSSPSHLSIPSIGVDEPIQALGLKDGVIDPPQGVVQWYDKTVTPGAPGNSVVAGHVTYNGDDDVFTNLEKMKVGQNVTITYANGATKTFQAVRTESVDKDKLEHRADVWGKNANPMLVLITCDAKSKLVGVHHVNNFVVWAKPIG